MFFLGFLCWWTHFCGIVCKLNTEFFFLVFIYQASAADRRNPGPRDRVWATDGEGSQSHHSCDWRRRQKRKRLNEIRYFLKNRPDLAQPWGGWGLIRQREATFDILLPPPCFIKRHRVDAVLRVSRFSTRLYNCRMWKGGEYLRKALYSTGSIIDREVVIFLAKF